MTVEECSCAACLWWIKIRIFFGGALCSLTFNRLCHCVKRVHRGDTCPKGVGEICHVNDLAWGISTVYEEFGDPFIYRIREIKRSPSSAYRDHISLAHVLAQGYILSDIPKPDAMLDHPWDRVVILHTGSNIVVSAQLHLIESTQNLSVRSTSHASQNKSECN